MIIIMKILTIMSVRSSINKVSSIRVLFFYVPYIYKNRVLANFQTRPQGDFFSWGMDRRTRFWNPHMETCRHTKNFNSKLVVSCRSLYASPEDWNA